MEQQAHVLNLTIEIDVLNVSSRVDVDMTNVSTQWTCVEVLIVALVEDRNQIHVYVLNAIVSMI